MKQHGFFENSKFKHKKVTRIRTIPIKCNDGPISQPEEVLKQVPTWKKKKGPTWKSRTLSFEEAPPENEKLVLVTTNLHNFKICAPASIIRQHMEYDQLNNLARIINWKYVEEDTSMGPVIYEN